jgi:hypothetical protein
VRRIQRSRNPRLAAAEERAALKAQTQLIGLYAPEAPEPEASRIPRDLTEIGDGELMSLFAEMSGWAEYHGTRYANAQVDEKFAESVLEIRRAAAVLNKATKSVTEAKALAVADEEVQEANEVYLEAYKNRKVEEVAYNNAERRERLISRELTRRTGRGDRENRNNRWTT